MNLVDACEYYQSSFIIAIKNAGAESPTAGDFVEVRSRGGICYDLLVSTHILLLLLARMQD